MPEAHVVDASGIDPLTGDWFELDQRQNSTMASTWTELLCVRKIRGAFEIAICLNGALGEDEGPGECGNEDDDCQDTVGRPLPPFLDGYPVAKSEDGLLCGALVVRSDDCVTIPTLDQAPLSQALQSLGWEPHPGIFEAASLLSLRQPQTTEMPPPLIEAYKSTSYWVDDEERFCLRIGEKSSRLEALYEGEGLTTATFVTAFNPEGQPLNANLNMRLHAEMLREIVKLERPHFLGEGRGDNGGWAPELSVLVLGLTFEQALHLGRYYKQNAIVWACDDAIAQLVLLR